MESEYYGGEQSGSGAGLREGGRAGGHGGASAAAGSARALRCPAPCPGSAPVSGQGRAPPGWDGAGLGLGPVSGALSGPRGHVEPLRGLWGVLPFRGSAGRLVLLPAALPGGSPPVLRAAGGYLPSWSPVPAVRALLGAGRRHRVLLFK